MMITETCWLCPDLAVWKFTGQKEGPPIVLVEFYACEKHAPYWRPKEKP